MERIGILGAGTWGLALARMLYNNGNEVTVWSSDPAKAETLSRVRAVDRLPNMVIPEGVRFTGAMEEACGGADIVVLAVASVYFPAPSSRPAGIPPSPGECSRCSPAP